MTNVTFLKFRSKNWHKTLIPRISRVRTLNRSLPASLFWEVQQDTAKKGFCLLDADFSSDKLHDIAFSIQSLWTADSRVWLKMPCRIMIFKLCEFEDHCYNINNYTDHHKIIDFSSFSTDKNKSTSVYLCLHLSMTIYQYHQDFY